ncbi:MAG: ribonuclease Z [Bacteroidia bacterium]|nr:ribonuclease Z [Bacteroidia bacterium]
MDFTLRIMGSASAKPVIDRFQSAQVLTVHGRSFLIDCGEGVQVQLQRFGVSIMKIDSIFISHIHGDHVFGIFGLLSTMGMLGRSMPLNIYAPVSFGPILKFFLSYYGEGVAFEIRHNPLKMKEPEVVYETKSLEISAFPLNHGIETFGFIFKEKAPQRNVWKHMLSRYEFTLTEIGTLKRGEDVVRDDEVIKCEDATYVPWIPRSYAYCSDTAPFPELAGWVKGVDLLYHETTYLKAQGELAAQRHHSTTVQAAQCALDAGAKKLVIAHYTSRVRDAAVFEAECRCVFPETYAASDGSIFDVPLVKPV